MRTFLGIPCPGEVKDELEPIRDDLEEKTPLKPVSKENFHMTIKFLGDISGNQLETIDRIFNSRLPTPGPLKLELNTVGVFPNVKHPSVAWVGVELTDALYELYEAVEEITVEQGFDPEEHDFRPHITIGRYKNGLDDRQSLLNWIKRFGEESHGSFEASALHLYESELNSDGPTYTSKVRWPL